MNIPSSSTTITSTTPGLVIVILLGREDESMERLKFSLPSSILSSSIVTLNGACIVSALNSTVNVPEL